MEIKIGTIVKSIAGHDKGSFYVVVGYENNMPLIADGRRRKLEKPKAKNPKHTAKTNTVTEPAELTNKKLRAVLHSFNFPNEGTGEPAC
ncbi:MAG: KOW domain-containing RNA-binding protein [Oscillospiraceae bacterium]|jgi:ribosomal protein L14E/L6E/L27E|nr:KOW domain-containing RNA-binding protein [Oscillospiraceae bacterium]